MARRMILLQTAVVGAMLVMACAAVLLLAVPKKAEAAFPGANGRIAYSKFVESPSAPGHFAD